MGVSIRGSPIARWLMENPIEKGGEVSRGSSAGFRTPHPAHGAKKNIRLVVAGNDEPETPLEELTEVLEEKKPWCVQAGAKRAIICGGGLFNGVRNQFLADLHMPLPGGGGTLFALPDIWGNLKETECYVILNGEYITGELAAWRPGRVFEWSGSCRHSPSLFFFYSLSK
ncbi:unnamed protein product [Cladocopium goreaui]|uniref:RNA-dependent RNA polymerase n=1 Tax=Cladocopium goreaui TaxID=2562237 RepID=A0A9P1D860_9DINO|nr:unnamed protein product [Cladocopium goreaui]